jgi:hypothetical protein
MDVVFWRLIADDDVNLKDIFIVRQLLKPSDRKSQLPSVGVTVELVGADEAQAGARGRHLPGGRKLCVDLVIGLFVPLLSPEVVHRFSAKRDKQHKALNKFIVNFIFG